MIRESVVGDTPQIDSTAYVDPSAIIIGRVIIGPNCYIGAGAVIRADRFSTDDEVARIVIGACCAIQDLSVLHVYAKSFLEIGDETIISHGSVIYGTTVIGNQCFVGCKSVINQANIHDRVFIRSNAIIENVIIPFEKLIDFNMVINSEEIVGSLRPISYEEKAFMKKALEESKEYPLSYKYSLEQ